MTPALCWWIDDSAIEAVNDRQRANALEIDTTTCRPASGFYLARAAGTLGLQHALAGANSLPVSVDLLEAGNRRARGGIRGSPLARACGLPLASQAHLVDATAGLGRDSATLARLGATVTPIERQPALHALLDDAWQRLHTSDAPAWAGQLRSPVFANAICWLDSASASTIDVIYLDPMFASPRRKARPQKALAWLAELAGPDLDAAVLLDQARHIARQRVVVKQHARSAPLARPDYQLEAKAIRFDVYLSGR